MTEGFFYISTAGAPSATDGTPLAKIAAATLLDTA
jgi:hypothetical protein